METGFYSYTFATASFSFLTFLLVFSRKKPRVTGDLLILASCVSALWGLINAASFVTPKILVETVYYIEFIRDFCWIGFLLSILTPQVLARLKTKLTTHLRVGTVWFIFPLIACGLWLVHLFLSLQTPHNKALIMLVWIALSISGLLIIEQLIRHTYSEKSASVKHICLGLGGIFVFDFFMHSNSLLFKHLDENIWASRGFVNGLITPLIALSAVRNPNWSVAPHVSRDVVSHSFTIIGAGVYLLIMSAVGYYIRLTEATWGFVFQIVFLSASGLLLVSILFSQRIKAHTRVLVSKHFFNNKYDYRQEWLRFTQTLAEQGDRSVPEKIVTGLSMLLQTEGGALWCKQSEGSYRLMFNDKVGAIPPDYQQGLESLISFMEHSLWLVDIDEYNDQAERYTNLKLPGYLVQNPKAWLLIPLPFQESLIGFVLIPRSRIVKSINWEDRDLLKLAGNQAAGLLAQYQTGVALMEAEQFTAFNKLSAYIVHDLKNILGQQSLIVSNSRKHKHNPAFVDDMVQTIDNSVSRMQKLMVQLRSGLRDKEKEAVEITPLILGVISNRSVQLPKPIPLHLDTNAVVEADPDRLKEVFNHIVQNAQEASQDSGSIELSSTIVNGFVIVTIKDTGIGMTQEFIDQRLFRPFDSTKGLTGMGIGVYESREFIHSLGGKISVRSSLGSGTTFTVSIPALKQPIVTNKQLEP